MPAQIWPPDSDVPLADKDQKRVAEKFREFGTIAVEAPPGTGKTFLGVYLALCANRLGWTSKSRPTLFLTFSRNARVQMEYEVSQYQKNGWMSKEEASTIAVSNYHAFYFDIIRRKAALWKSATVLRPVSILEHQDNIRVILTRFNLDGRIAHRAAVQASLVYALQRFQLKDLAGYDEQNLLNKEVLQEVYNVAVNQLRNGRLYYDDFAPLFLNLLELCPEIVEWMQLVYPVVILDEFQDTDLQQQQILFKMHPKRLVTLCDRYQMIYEWRGARADTAAKTNEEFGLTKESFAELTHNHRSGNEADLVNFIMQLRTDELRGKQLVDSKHSWLTLQSVQKWPDVPEASWKSIPDETKCLTHLRSRHLIDHKETTVLLTKNNYLAEYLYNNLRLKKEKAEPHRCRWIGSDNNFDEKIRDHVWYLRAVNDDGKLRVWLGQLLDDMLPRLDYLQKVSFAKEFALDGSKVLARRTSDVFKSARQNIVAWLDSVKVADRDSIARGLSELLVVAGILLDKNGYLDPDVVYFIKDLSRSVERLAARKSSIDWCQFCDCLEDDLVRASYLRLRHPPSGLYISTIHQSKGREFDHVIIPWLAGKGEPHVNDQGARYPVSYVFDHFEDRRLLYVAFTRARRHVTIIYPEADPSPFIKEWRLA
jgi:superfamily I DNA/RNA helicase